MVILENGARYEGEWLNGLSIRQGRGIQVWPDGSMYVGQFRDNEIDGIGTYTWSRLSKNAATHSGTPDLCGPDGICEETAQNFAKSSQTSAKFCEFDEFCLGSRNQSQDKFHASVLYQHRGISKIAFQGRRTISVKS